MIKKKVVGMIDTESDEIYPRSIVNKTDKTIVE